MVKKKKYDFFISHASDDKTDFVRPLAEELDFRGVKVWYDEFTLKPGMSVRQSIDKGLVNSKFGIIVISPSYIGRKWTEWELNGLIQLNSSDYLIIPIWHKISRDEVVSWSPSLADVVALKSEIGVKKIVTKLLDVFNSDIENFWRGMRASSEMAYATTTFLENAAAILCPDKSKLVQAGIYVLADNGGLTLSAGTEIGVSKPLEMIYDKDSTLIKHLMSKKIVLISNPNDLKGSTTLGRTNYSNISPTIKAICIPLLNLEEIIGALVLVVTDTSALVDDPKIYNSVLLMAGSLISSMRIRLKKDE